MAKLIMKSHIMKPAEKEHVARYIKYIATRENVELSENTDRYKPATAKQRELIENMLADYPEMKQSFEYEDFIKVPTIGSAHELINHGLESYVAPAQEDKGGYVKYIAERPGVEKTGKHGLFTDSGIAIDLDDTAKEVSESGSNIFTHIISLKREDARKCGYDTADAWTQLLRAHRDDIARAMHIEPQNFKWYAAFHNESHHPHVHIVAYSTKPSEAWLNTNGIEQIKSILANDIFRDEMDMVFRQKDEARQNVKDYSDFAFKRLISSVGSGTYTNYELESELLKISDSLKTVKGKKQYGYLPPDIKNRIDNVVDVLSADSRIAELYDVWYTEKLKTFELYTDKMPDKIPLSKNKEFKSIKNMVINQILNMENVFAAPDNDIKQKNTRDFASDYKIGKRYYEKGDISAAIEYFEKAACKDNRYAQYQLGKIYLTEKDFIDVPKAISFFKSAADAGNDYALYQLGKIFYFGTGTIEKDEALGLQYLTEAKESGNQPAAQMLQSLEEHRNIHAAMCSLNLLHCFARLFTPEPQLHNPKTHRYTDRKEYARIAEKKRAQGLKPE